MIWNHKSDFSTIVKRQKLLYHSSKITFRVKKKDRNGRPNNNLQKKIEISENFSRYSYKINFGWAIDCYKHINHKHKQLHLLRSFCSVLPFLLGGDSSIGHNGWGGGSGRLLN